MAGTQLSAVAPLLLPPQVTAPIFDKSFESSAVMSLAQRVPLAVNAQTAVPVMLDVPRAGWVVEGGSKPVGTSGVGVKTMQGKKVALLIPVSQEVANTNAAGLFGHLQTVLPTAIGRAFDYAAVHGLDYATGGAGPFPTYLAQTPNTQVIGASAANVGGVYADLWKGVQQVVNAPIPGYDVTGFAADPRLGPELALSVDNNGRPILVDAYPNANSGPLNGSLIGRPIAYNPGISGKNYKSGNAVQVVTISGSPTGGTFTLTVAGYTTSALAFNAASSTVQTAIQALGPGTPFGGNPGANATVSGSAGGPYTVTFTGAAAPITAASSLTGGTNPSVTVAQSPQQDSGLRAIGGDWSQCAYGVGMDISVQVSREASYTPDGGTTWISAFQNNLVLLLVEAYFGFLVNDPNAFVAYTHATGS